MPDFSAKDVQKLRQLTGVGMLDAKTRPRGERAATWTRPSPGCASRAWPARPSGPTARPPRGRWPSAAPTVSPSIVQLRSETDFVAKSDEFVALVAALADLVAARARAPSTSRPTSSTD